MTNQVTSVNTNAVPIGAYGIGGSRDKLEPGKIVVYPPQNVYKYSIYDELDLGKDRYRELLLSTEPKSVRMKQKTIKARQRISKAFNWVLFLAGGAFALYHRNSIKNFCKILATKIRLLKK